MRHPSVLSPSGPTPHNCNFLQAPLYPGFVHARRDSLRASSHSNNATSMLKPYDTQNFLLVCLFRNGCIASLISAPTAFYQTTCAGFFVHRSDIRSVLYWWQWLWPPRSIPWKRCLYDQQSQLGPHDRRHPRGRVCYITCRRRSLRPDGQCPVPVRSTSVGAHVRYLSSRLCSRRTVTTRICWYCSRSSQASGLG